MKPCTKCKKRPRRSENQRWCNGCHAAYMRENRRSHSELSDEQRKRANARSYARVYRVRGHLEPKPCEDCGGPWEEMHHDDYDRPLEVTWLCRPCHVARTVAAA